MANEALLGYLQTGDLMSLAKVRHVPPQRVSRKRGRVAYVGDSLGVGTKPYLKAKGDVRGGRGSREGVSHLKRMKGYSTVVLDLGTNDASPRELARSIRKAKRYARGAQIVMPLLHGPGAHEKNQVIKRSGVRYVRTQKPGGDGIHYSPQGYRRRARLITRNL